MDISKQYDDQAFFEQYSQMTRSREGLSGAGEWSQLAPMFPSLAGKKVLDLGCGYGWHCKYAADHGAAEVLGLDSSEKMIRQARLQNSADAIRYEVQGLEEYSYPSQEWDCVISNLVLHYIADLDSVFHCIHRTLKPGGVFLMNIEHPVFTAGVNQDWVRDQEGNPLYWPVDGYFMPGPRHTSFLGCDVVKEHHTLTQILMGLIEAGFTLERVEEARPPKEMMGLPGMTDELRRPMMLLVKASA